MNEGSGLVLTAVGGFLGWTKSKLEVIGCILWIRSVPLRSSKSNSLEVERMLTVFPSV